LFFVGSFTRANGFVNSAFILHYGVKNLVRRGRILIFVSSILGAAFAASPMFLVQAWHINNFCWRNPDPGFWNGTRSMAEPTWCPPQNYLKVESWTTIVRSILRPYEHVQEKYWYVRFLGQWNTYNLFQFATVLPVFIPIAVAYLHDWYMAKKLDILSLGGILFDSKTKRNCNQQNSCHLEKECNNNVCPCWGCSVFPAEVALWFHATFLVTFAICYVFVIVSIESISHIPQKRSLHYL
jgi:hypothetical protein